MASSVAYVKLDLSLHDCHPGTTIAPSIMDIVLSGIIRSSSNFILYPRPAHSGQAPKGLLNEKLLGSISSMLMLQSGHEKLCENVSIFPSVTSTYTSPSVRPITVSRESVSLFSIPSRTTSLSTTISMLCLMFLSSLISSDSSYILPSTRTLTYPLFTARSNILACSPLRPLTTGAKSWIFVPSGSAIMASVIWSTL